MSIKIIELVGLPGVGKTTISKKLSLYLENMGYTVYNREDILYPNLINNIHYRFICLLLKPKVYMMIIKALKIYKLYGKGSNRFLYFEKFLYLYERIRWFVYSKAETNDKTILILDEGIIQYLSSIPHDSSIASHANEYRISEVKDIYKKTLIVNCFQDFDTVIERILNRGKYNDRFYLSNRDKMRHLLKIKSTNLDIIIKENGINLIDYNDNYDTDTFFDYIHNCLRLKERVDKNEKS